MLYKKIHRQYVRRFRVGTVFSTFGILHTVTSAPSIKVWYPGTSRKPFTSIDFRKDGSIFSNCLIDRFGKLQYYAIQENS